MRVRHTWAVVLLWGSCLATAGTAGRDDSLAQMVGLAASLNEMAKACGHMAAADVEAAQREQRQAELAQGTDAAAYDAAYAASKAQFTRRWSAMSKAQQQSSCAQMQQRSGSAAAQVLKR